MAVSSKISPAWKRYLSQIWTDTSPFSSRSASALITRRGQHTSVYDKNRDEQVRPTVVPEDVIQPHPDNYWAPHPKTGVFGPVTEHNLSPESESAKEGEGSVMEEKAWFRPTSLEDLEKPSTH